MTAWRHTLLLGKKELAWIAGEGWYASLGSEAWTEINSNPELNQTRPHKFWDG